MRILLAEDELSLTRALVKILEKNNYAVDAVHNGEDALRFLEEGTYDAAILDIMMPKLDGISVLRELRKRQCNVPVLLLSARSEVADKVLGLDSGANDYLTKPFDTKELLARIRVLTRPNPSFSNCLTYGNVSLDRSSYILSSPSGSFRLANKEYQVIETLMCNPKNVIPSERLLEKIWGYDSDTEINVVWVYISYLRKKLAALDANIQIKAIRNAGYTLEELK